MSLINLFGNTYVNISFIIALDYHYYIETDRSRGFISHLEKNTTTPKNTLVTDNLTNGYKVWVQTTEMLYIYVCDYDELQELLKEVSK